MKCVRKFTVVALLLLARCAPSESSPGGPNEVLVFRERSMVIDRFEQPTPTPVTVGSVVRGDLLKSDSPAIVTIDPAGNLLAHQNGHAVVQSVRSGSRLEVEVRATGRLSLEPAVLSLSKGKTADLVVLADGSVVPASAVTWLTSNPATAAVEGGHVAAGIQPGSAEIVARYGGAEASATVVVEADPQTQVLVSAPQPRLSEGAVTQLRLTAPAGATVLWTSSNENVLTSVGSGIFHAKLPGRSLACAKVLERSSCASIRVVPRGSE